jgi:hypothetical protein
MQLDEKAEGNRRPACAFGGHLWLTVPALTYHRREKSFLIKRSKYV